MICIECHPTTYFLEFKPPPIHTYTSLAIRTHHRAVKPKILKALIVFQINGHAMERPTAFHMAMTRTRIYVEKSIIIHVNREYFVIASVWTFKKYAMGLKTVQMVAMNYSVTCARTRPNSLVQEKPTA